MRPVPERIKKPYIAFLEKSGIVSEQIHLYLKWLGDYLDFKKKILDKLRCV